MIKLWEQYLQENNNNPTASEITFNYKNIFLNQEMWYRRGKCQEFKSLFSKEGRIKFQMCATRAKIHGLKKATSYLKTIHTNDSQLKKALQEEILDGENRIKTTLKLLAKFEKEKGISSTHYDTDKASGIYQNLIDRE
jgi:hypothetical protein